jgi:hypothetical protein
MRRLAIILLCTMVMVSGCGGAHSGTAQAGTVHRTGSACSENQLCYASCDAVGACRMAVCQGGVLRYYSTCSGGNCRPLPKCP